MPNIYKATMFFQLGSNGWTESWHIQKDSHAQVQTALTPVRTARGALLATGARIVGTRISDIAVRGDALVSGIGVGNELVGAGNRPRDQATASWLATFWAGGQFRRALHLRGIPDAWINYFNVNLLDTPRALSNAFDAYVTALRTAQFGLLVVNNDRVANPRRDITEIALDANGFYKLTIPGANDWGLGTQFRVTGMRKADYPNLGGLQRVQAINGNVFTTFKKGVSGMPAYQGQGRARRVLFTVPVITRSELVRPTSRKTGKAFFVQRGRARAR